MFVGTAAEAFLAAEAKLGADRIVSVFAIAVDRLDALMASRGKATRDHVLAQVASAIGSIGAPIGVTAACYPDGVFVLVAPLLRSAAARALAEALRTTVRGLGLANSEATAADNVTISIGIVTARRGRTELVADARRLLKEVAEAGGNRAAATDLTSH
jgi:GGDEF domain-containing protein